VSSNIVAPVITPSTNLEPMRSIYTSSNFETLVCMLLFAVNQK
jgi:hypothetical protein